MKNQAILKNIESKTLPKKRNNYITQNEVFRPSLNTRHLKSSKDSFCVRKHWYDKCASYCRMEQLQPSLWHIHSLLPSCSFLKVCLCIYHYAKEIKHWRCKESIIFTTSLQTILLHHFLYFKNLSKFRKASNLTRIYPECVWTDKTCICTIIRNQDII